MFLKKWNFTQWNFTLAACFGIAVLYHALIRFIFNEVYPLGTFLFSPWDRFKDLWNLLPHIREMNPYRWNGSVYFPFTYVTLLPFSWFRDLQALILFILLSIGGFALCFKAFEVPRIGWIGMVLCSYPMWFAMDRANPEIFVFLFLAAFLNAFIKKKKSAPVWLAMAIALKGYPVVFLALLMKHRKWPEIFWSCVLAILFSLGAGMIFEGGLKATHQRLLDNLSFHQGLYVIGDLCTRFNLGIYGWLKVWLPRNNADYSIWFLPKYMAFAIGVFGFATLRMLFSRGRNLEVDVLLLSIAMLILPQLSYDYKLLHLYLPIFVYFGRRSFMDALVENKALNLPHWMWLILPILIPFQYWILWDEVGAGSVLRPLALMGLFVSLLISYQSSFWRGRHYRES